MLVKGALGVGKPVKMLQISDKIYSNEKYTQVETETVFVVVLRSQK